MQKPNLSEIIQAWQQRTQRDSPLKMAEICIQSMRLLAQGQPVSAIQLAEASRISMTETSDALNRLNQCGCEFDAKGNLVGAVLTLNPTPHQLQVNGHQLFAWCALDTLFLPALLQQLARVESTCPATGAKIRLTVTPEGIATVDPPETVLSIVIPGVTPNCEVGAKSGPQGPVCSTMHFFSSREAAST
jgi:alkylmercury lyase